MRLLFDIETNGLLDELDTVHSLVMINIDNGVVYSCADQEGYMPIELGLTIMDTATMLIGHNIQDFDLPALEKVYGYVYTYIYLYVYIYTL